MLRSLRSKWNDFQFGNLILLSNVIASYSLGSYGSLASYFTGLAARFTRDEQVSQLTSFADKQTTLFGSSDATLRTAVRNAQYELFWDSKYLSTIASILDEKVDGGAMAVSCVSTVLIAFGVLLNYILLH